MKPDMKRKAAQAAKREAITFEKTSKKRPGNIQRSMLPGRIFFKEGYPNESN